METNEKQVSNNIKGLLKRYNITMEEVAKKLGISRRTVVMIVNNPFSYKLNFLRDVADAIGCNIIDIFKPL